jgi:hemoglobin
MTTPTVYERGGGHEAFEKLTEVFYAKVLKDDLLGDLFRNMSSEHSKNVAHFLSEVLVDLNATREKARKVMRI